MKRVVFIVEGDTEVRLVDKLIGPYLTQAIGPFGYNAQPITTNRKQHKKGGVTSYGLFKNEIERTLSQGNVIVTTIIDFFRLPTDFPGYTTDSNRIDEIEQSILNEFEEGVNFIPYVQRHEIEALMFSAIDGFDLIVENTEQLQKIMKIREDYPNPEDINNNPESAPSKRLEAIYNYDKTADAALIFEMLTIEQITSACPRFKKWLDSLEQLIRSEYESLIR